MDYQEIQYGPAEDAAPGVVQVTLDRPAALNAYTSQMCDELTDALLRYARDEDARVPSARAAMWPARSRSKRRPGASSATAW
jgi:enoyl-CoA hydratase/carnithine racemase